MFFKLLKHEFKNNRNTFLILYGVLLAFAIIARVTGGIDETLKSYGRGSTNSIAFVLYAFTLLVIGVFVFVQTIRSFNYSLFKRPGYLNLTLPVSTEQLVFSKILMFVFWCVVTMIVFVVSIFVFVPSADLIIPSIQDLFTSLFDGSFQWGSLILLGLISVTNVLLFFALCAFLHTKWIKSYRPGIGIAIYILCSIVTNRIMEIVAPYFYFNLGGFGIRLGTQTTNYSYMMSSSDPNYFVKVLLPGYIIHIILAVVFYLLTKYFLEKKIEID